MASQADGARSGWLIGDGLIADKKFGKALRSLKAPGTAYDNMWMGGKDPQPAHYRDYYHGRDDKGGVHVNSGIPNHAFYLAAIALGGYSWNAAGKVWFETITDGDLAERCSFSRFAAKTAAITSSRHGALAEAAVRDAWHRVGVAVLVGSSGV